MDDDSTDEAAAAHDPASAARLRALWNHKGWKDVFSSREERWRLLVLAIDGIQRDRSLLAEFIHMLPWAARKPDPDASVYDDTRALMDIFEAVAGAYGQDLENPQAPDVDEASLEVLHGAALKLLGSPSSDGMAKAAQRASMELRRKTGWGNALVQCLELAAEHGVFGGADLSATIRQHTLWSWCPIESTRVPLVRGDGRPVHDSEGRERFDSVDLRHLAWERLSEQQSKAAGGYQRPGARLLDRWCEASPLRPIDGACPDLREKALDLLKTLGVDGKAARNMLYAAEDMRVKRAAG